MILPRALQMHYAKGAIWGSGGEKMQKKFCSETCPNGSKCPKMHPDGHICMFSPIFCILPGSCGPEHWLGASLKGSLGTGSHSPKAGAGEGHRAQKWVKARLNAQKTTNYQVRTH